MSLFAVFSILGPSMGFGYSAVIIPTLTSGVSDLKVDSQQASWIGQSLSLNKKIS